MLPKLKITVQHIDGITGTYPVTPWIIDQWEQMAQASFLKTFANVESAEVGQINLLGFLAERQAGNTVAAWREPYTKSLDSTPFVELADDPKDDKPAPSSGTSS